MLPRNSHYQSTFNHDYFTNVSVTCFSWVSRLFFMLINQLGPALIRIYCQIGNTHFHLLNHWAVKSAAAVELALQRLHRLGVALGVELIHYQYASFQTWSLIHFNLGNRKNKTSVLNVRSILRLSTVTSSVTTHGARSHDWNHVRITLHPTIDCFYGLQSRV